MFLSNGSLEIAFWKSTLRACPKKLNASGLQVDFMQSSIRVNTSKLPADFKQTSCISTCWATLSLIITHSFVVLQSSTEAVKCPSDSFSPWCTTIPFKLYTFVCNSRNISTFVMIKTALYELKSLLLYITILLWACHMTLRIKMQEKNNMVL